MKVTTRSTAHIGLVLAVSLFTVFSAHGNQISISAPSNRYLELSGGSGPFGPSATFELPVRNRTDGAVKATVVCDLLYERAEEKDHFDVMSFHEVLLQPGDSDVNVHFQTLNMTLRGRGSLRVYLTKHLIPDPKPQRVMSLIAGAEVYILNKPITATFRDIDLTPISNTIRIPAVTDPRLAADIPASPKAERSDGPTEVILELEHTLAGHVVSVTSIAFSPDGRHLASCGEYRNSLNTKEPYPLYVWDIASESLQWNPSEEKDHLYAVAFVSDTQLLSGAQSDKAARLWALPSPREQLRFVGHKGTVSSIVPLPSQKAIVTASTDGSIGIWSIADASMTRTIDAGCAYPCPLALTPNANALIAADKQGALRIWDVATWREVGKLQGHSDSVYDIDVSPDGALVLSCSRDNTARLWELARRSQVARFNVNGRERAQGAFLGAGRHVLVGDDIYDLKTKEKVQSLDMKSVRAVATSLNGTRVATGGSGSDKLLRVWRYHPEGGGKE
jgi:WD40 repeat protein